MRDLQELSSEGAAALGKMKALQESLQREKERADGLDTKLKNAKVRRTPQVTAVWLTVGLRKT